LPARPFLIRFFDALEINALLGGLGGAKFAEAGSVAGIALRAVMPRAQRVAQRPLPFGAALQAVNVVGTDEVLDLSGDEIAEIGIIQARAAGMAGGSPTVKINFIKPVHALDLWARAVVLLHPRNNFHAAFFCFGGDLLHRVGQVEVARAQAVRLHFDVAIVLRMGGDKVAGRIARAVEAGPRGLERIAVQHKRVDAGAVLDVVEKSRDAVLQQISHLGLKPDHNFRRRGRGIGGAAADRLQTETGRDGGCRQRGRFDKVTAGDRVRIIHHGTFSVEDSRR
jgi:hypothetical protein